MQFNIINAIFQYEVNLIGGINIFQWEDFKEVADELIKNPQEAYVRSAMGRYYYSIFGSTRDYLVNVMMNVAIDISVPTDDNPNDKAGGTFHDERALELLGST